MRLLTLKNFIIIIVSGGFVLLLISFIKCAAPPIPSYVSNSGPESIQLQHSSRQSQSGNKWDYPNFDDDSVVNKITTFSSIAHSQLSDPLRFKQQQSQNGDEINDIICEINDGKEVVGCKREGNEVYVPFFSFLSKYFEIFGRIEKSKSGPDPDDPEDQGQEQEKFIWLHQNYNIKIFRPKVPYNSQGSFAFFDNYNVEVRERVKCISGIYGVPISTQWDSKGYFYPIQIAQFGLSHYSKYIQEGEPTRIHLFPSSVSSASARSKSYSDKNPSFQIPADHTVKIDLSKVPKTPRILTLRWLMKADDGTENNEINSENNRPLNITISAQVKYEGKIYNLNYITQDFHIQWRGEGTSTSEKGSIWHGLGSKSQNSWQEIIRDLGVDLQKGILQQLQQNIKGKGKKATINLQSGKVAKSKIFLVNLSIESNVMCTVQNLSISTNEHKSQFFQAAEWFIANQDSNGGWSIPIKRKFASDFYPTLKPGWYSAMAQGHALSLLSRAFYLKKYSRYSDACHKAVQSIFDKSGHENGVRAIFLEKFPFFEEYPTTPSTFVLNGFMYSLLGLYDSRGISEKADKLYSEGIRTLKTLLPLYDTGSGSLYDLRHFTVPGISPNLARLDYHVTHINQLLTFASFEKDSIFSAVAERFLAYTRGERAPHN